MSVSRLSQGFLILIFGSILLISCKKNEKAEVADLQIKGLPAMSARNIETMYTDSGRVTLIMRSPLINEFKSAEGDYTEFPEGIKVLFYDMQKTPQASISAKFARYTDKDEQWELRDSVVVINEQGGILETELLYWNQNKERVWSDRFVQYTDKEQIVRGTGFESDQRFEKWKIKNVSATIYIEDEQKGYSGN